MTFDGNQRPTLFDMDDENPLLAGLNSAQREAVKHMDGPMLVLAGPGSGKTRVVTHRIAWLLQNGVRDSNIAALTFTNKAADEMKTRLQNLAPGNRVWIGTFHRFCAFILRYHASYVGLEDNYAIYDSDQSKKLLDEVVNKNILPNGIDVQKIAAGISWAKNALVSAEDYCAQDGSILGKVIEDAYPAYQAALKKANAVDFDDLLFHVAVLLRDNPEIRANLDYRFRYILVDEYQDTNLVQYTIARALSIDYPNLAATGDPDQSIYGWRGANIRNIMDFEKDFPDAKVVRLEQNYRSDKSVLRLADALIKHNKYRKDKDLFTENKEGVSPRVLVNLDQNEEAEAIAAEIAAEIAAGKRRPRDYAIFYRMNALSRNLEYALKRYGVPFQLVRGLEFFNRKEVKDVCSYLQLIHNPSDVVSFKRIVNLPARGVGKISLARLELYAQENNVTLFEAARAAGRISGLSSKVQKALTKFVSLIDRLGASFKDGTELRIVLSVLLEETKYLDHLRSSAKTEEDEQRIANIQELLTEVREFDADFAQMESEHKNAEIPFYGMEKRQDDRLGAFLEQIALISDVDSWNANDDRVSLMTLHAAKGLEFPVVYIIALEDGVLPHERSSNDKSQLEEERRLLFVGVTRAMEELRMTRTRFREFRGSYTPSLSSRFLFEFPKTGVDSYDSLDAWIQEITNESQINPDANIVVPRFFERKEGVSQRRALWEQGIASMFQDPFAAEAEQANFVSRRRRPNVADVDECVDPEPENDYSQIAPDVCDYADEPSLETDVDLDDAFQPDPENDENEIAFYADFDEDGELAADFDEPPAAPIKKKPTSRKRSPREISPNALSTGSTLAKKRSSGKSRKNDDVRGEIGFPPKEIVVHAFVQHKNYGVGVVNDIFGPSFDRIARISFLSVVGEIDLSINDPNLSLVAIGRGGKDS